MTRIHFHTFRSGGGICQTCIKDTLKHVLQSTHAPALWLKSRSSPPSRAASQRPGFRYSTAVTLRRGADGDASAWRAARRFVSTRAIALPVLSYSLTLCIVVFK